MEPCDLPAAQARWLIGAKQLSPVELFDSCARRIARLDHAVNALPTLDLDRGRDAARQAELAVMRGDSLGPLHGLPLGIKDLEDTAGLRTTYGSPIFAEHVPAQDQEMVARLKRAGGIVIAKTNTPEFGAGANTRNAVFGATGNPFDPTRSAAGSSGGSAVALACGMLPLASGSDMGGSLRNPAAFCGIVGFRPSPGVVPNEKRGLGWSHLGTLGPMARHVADVALMLGAMAGDDGRDPLCSAPARAPQGFGGLTDLGGLRVAATEDFGFVPVEAMIRRVFRARLAALRPLFCELRDAHPAHDGAEEAFATLRALNFVAAHEEKCRLTPDRVGPNVRQNTADGLRLGLGDVARAMAIQTKLYRAWQDFFAGGVDVLVSPAITISPRPWRELYPTQLDGVPTTTYFQWLGLAYAVTLVGHPAIAIPLGRDEAGLPFGLQIVGRRGGDQAVLAVAAAIEAAIGEDATLGRPRPDLAALAAAPPISAMEGFRGFD
jgi:Asp-tRNA(Asn)/Glu-tRNA(Gln) amidotransferase A subunit family amidase